METAQETKESSLLSKEILAAPSERNGGKAGKYYWTQTLYDLSIYFPIDMSIRAKYIKVKVDQNHLKITITEGCVVYNLISKDFHEKVESINNDTWIWIIEEGEIEDYKGKYINFTIDKDNNTKHWWKCAMKGDPCIDTTLCKKEIIIDLDDQDQRTSTCYKFDGFIPKPRDYFQSQEEIQKKKEMLDNFMKQHPEMDFSKCVFK